MNIGQALNYRAAPLPTFWTKPGNEIVTTDKRGRADLTPALVNIVQLSRGRPLPRRPVAREATVRSWNPLWLNS